MSENALTTNFSSFDALIEQAEEQNSALDQAATGFSGADFTKFLSFGDTGPDGNPWTYGQDGAEIHPESVWIIDPNTTKLGYFGFEKNPDGTIIKGKRPDQVWQSFAEGLPPESAKKSYMNPAVQFCAVCASSPNKDEVGAYISHTESRRMATGFMELAAAMRKRLRMAGRAKAEGDMDGYEKLLSDFYPRVRFTSKNGVKIPGKGRHNKGILEHIGWGKPVVVEGADEDEGVAEIDDPTPRRRKRG